MYFIKTPKYIQQLFPGFTWSYSLKNKVIYLTFDDGPIPESTPGILDVLRRYNARATFFCVGDNIQKHPTLFRQIIKEGHAIGSHTHNHLSGWTSSSERYVENVHKAAELAQSELFRPPYGRIRPKQAKILSKDYQIVMWDVLSGDFDEAINEEMCFNNVINNATDGSIIVFHDSIKTKNKVDIVLPKVLEYYLSRGFTFNAIEN